MEGFLGTGGGGGGALGCGGSSSEADSRWRRGLQRGFIFEGLGQEALDNYGRSMYTPKGPRLPTQLLNRV